MAHSDKIFHADVVDKVRQLILDLLLDGHPWKPSELMAIVVGKMANECPHIKEVFRAVIGILLDEDVIAQRSDRLFVQTNYLSYDPSIENQIKIVVISGRLTPFAIISTISQRDGIEWDNVWAAYQRLINRGELKVVEHVELVED